MSKPITVLFEEEGANKVVGAVDKVGDSTRRMSKQVDDSAASHTRLGERVGNNEARFRGTADLLDGLGSVTGINTEKITGLTRGLSDLSGGFEIVSGILPAITSMFPKLAGAMTFISAHPLMIGILVGGAIIAGLILLEKKFGVVSGAVHGLGDAMNAAWQGGIKPAINLIIGGVELLARAWAMPFTLLSKIPGVGNLVPDGLANIRLPRLDVGGTVLQTGIAVVHRGEIVSPAAGSPSLSAGGTSVTIIVQGSVVTERELVDAVHEGLLDKQRRSGNLGIAA
jgi:hypothetical protein